MPLLKDRYTSEDYWNLPEGERAELIDGKFYDMAPPSRIHQKLVFTISRIIGNYIADHHGSCEVYPAPFAVFIKDLIFESVSPSSRKLDYGIKNGIYSQSGVREYWIVDPAKERVTVYHYEDDAAPVIYSFAQDIPVGIYPGLTIKINDLLENF